LKTGKGKDRIGRIKEASMKLTGCWLSALLLILISAPAGDASPASIEEPDRVAVQHILISFKGAIPKPTVTRTKEEAQKLAEEVFERANKGEDFDALVKQYTNDEYPGVYRMSNKGITPDQSKQEYPREGMVKSFGDVSFSLPVGGIGMAKYDSQKSRFGWHIIKRIE
jgi:parvulin-like peptidyl-prolyl isomerase